MYLMRDLYPGYKTNKNSYNSTNKKADNQLKNQEMDLNRPLQKDKQIINKNFKDAIYMKYSEEANP